MEAKDFLEKNGFEYCSESNNFQNDNCIVCIGESGYTIILYEVEASVMYSQDLNIYWLIGVLTYYGLIDKSYIQ